MKKKMKKNKSAVADAGFEPGPRMWGLYTGHTPLGNAR